MKKYLLLLLCATLSCSLAFAQGAESEEESFDKIQFIPRIELNPIATFNGSNYDGSRFDLGSSSIFSLIEGNIGKSNFYYSTELHLLSTDPKGLYTNSFNSQEATWLDWAYIGYSIKGFGITVGKQVLLLGSNEYAEYDFDNHADLSSMYYNDLQPFQYGVNLKYTTPSEMSTFTVQFASSPFGNRPFVTDKDGNKPLFAYSFKWDGTYGCWTPLWSYNLFESYALDAQGESLGTRGTPKHSFSLGNCFNFGKFDLMIDYSHRFYHKRAADPEGTLVGQLCYDTQESFVITVKGGFEFAKTDVFGYKPEEGELHSSFVPTSVALMKELYGKNYVFAGAFADWYPLKNSRMVKVYAAAGWNNWSQAANIKIGVTAYLDVLKLRKATEWASE